MNFIKPHYKSSQPVYYYGQIKKDAEEMKKFVDQEFPGTIKEAYAISHCQVNPEPFAFFAVHSDLAGVWQGKKMFPHKIICNPRILKAEAILTDERVIGGKKQKVNLKNTYAPDEACMWFPFRAAKKVRRFFQIKVQYQTPGWFGLLRTRTETIEGLKAHIFQHAVDHMKGKNIHFKSVSTSFKAVAS